MKKIRQTLITSVFLIFCMMSLQAQEKPLKREVTMYNPYKPSLNETKKRSFLPEMNDTAQFRPEFRYNVTAMPFMPSYTISPIKAATLQPDPLSKLYRSYVNLGFGNYMSPLAEISITNERSKKGAIGFYGRHFSTNGKIKLDEGQKVFAGSMDNELSLFGKKFYKGGVIGGSVDFNQITRHAYGFDPEILNYSPSKKDTRLNYKDIGAGLSLASTTLDSSIFLYDFDLRYDHFFTSTELYQHNIVLKGVMSKTFSGFYAGSGLDLEYFNTPDSILGHAKYIAGISPFIKKATPQWNFKLGMQAVLERNLDETAVPHIYPDLAFGFNIIPSYVNFFTTLGGGLEVNDPLSVVKVNPYIIPDGSLFRVPNTSRQLEAAAGFRGNSGIEGSYELSARYSLVNDMILFTNSMNNTDPVYGRGNYFSFLTDDADIFTLHGELSGKFTDKLAFNSDLNWYRYTMTNLSFPYNRPDWDASFGLKYNLRDKILAGVQVDATGARKELVSRDKELLPARTFDMPWHLNLNLSAEYRYSRILSFWARFNNLSNEKYYEWAFYPTHRFMFMAGFTYSL